MSHYIPLEYDRSHLSLIKKTIEEEVMLDNWDILLIIANLIAIASILFFYLSTSALFETSRGGRTRRSR